MCGIIPTTPYSGNARCATSEYGYGMPVAGLNVMLTLSWIDFSSRLRVLHVVGLERHVAAELLRDADRALPAVRHVRVVRNRRLLLEVAQQTPGRRC